MITLQTADNVLKSYYLDAVTEQVNSRISPFLSKIEKNSKYVTGKEIAKNVKLGVAGGVAAGTETGDLPTARYGGYLTMKSSLKNFYGTIEISDKAIRASANGEGAFVNLLNDEMESLIKGAKYNFSRMLFGDGSGKIASVTEVAAEETLTLDSVVGLAEGAYIDLYDGDALLYSGLKVVGVDGANKQITLSGATMTSDGVPAGAKVVVSGTTIGSELTGLGAIFGAGELYGLQRNSFLSPYKQESVGEINEAVLQKAIDEVEKQGGGKVNIILCSRGVRRAIINACSQKQTVLSTTTIGEDPSVMTFNGIPVVVDDFCAEGTLYLLNTDDFTLCQLCDWQWLEGEDGKILKQVAGKPVYTATLVKYAELLCEKPCGQGMLSGITEA